MNIIWTNHAEDRQKQWERRLGITKEDVEEILNNPEQIVPGDLDVLVAQTRRASGLVRVPFVESEGMKRVITVYWTSKVEKY